MTKNQRLTIYKQMLASTKTKRIQSNYPTYYNFCGALWKINVYYSIEDFPELMAYKPKHKYVARYYKRGRLVNRRNTDFWWSPYSYNIRVRILEEIINNMKKS